MAGDWIACSKDLPRKREILAIASATGKLRREVVSIMIEFWIWVDSETADGLLPGITLEHLGAVIEGTDARFWSAVVQAGWLRVEQGGLVIPHFETWMGSSAKKRLRDTKRKRTVRQMSASEADTPRRSCPHDAPNAPDKTCSDPEPESDFGGRPPTNKDLRHPVPDLSASEADIWRTRGEDRKGEGIQTPPPTPQRGECARGFETFWTAYPRRTSKKKAAEVWNRLSPSEELQKQIMAALERHKRCSQWQRGVIPHAATWLNQQRWEDELSSGSGGAATEDELREKVLRMRKQAAEMEKDAYHPPEAGYGKLFV